MNKRKIVALLLAAMMVCSLFVSPALAAEDAGEPVVISDTRAPKFTDTDGHWAESAIVRWAEAGIVEGYGDGTVEPGRNLKRAELATILTRLLGLKKTAPANTFRDVPADAWYADAVLKCARAGIMLGDGNGRANPETPIDRQQAIVMVGRALGVKPVTGHSLNRFDDGDSVADWAKPYMIALTDMGILNGLPTGEGDHAIVAPTVNINRASTFALLDKAIAQYITAPCTVTVEDANKFVVINSSAEEAGVVTVTGKTAGVVVAIGTTDGVELDKATVGTLKVDAPVDVTIKKGSAVTELDANAAAKVTNNGTVTNLNTNADDVTFDGNKPSKVNTAEDVEPAKDSKGNEVTTAPAASTGGSSNRPSTSPTYDITVTVTEKPGGTVTVVQGDKQNADGEGNFQPIIFTITPDSVQKGDVLPYTVTGYEMTWPAGNEQVEVELERGENGEQTYTFTPQAAGVYNIIPHLEQPIIRAEMFIAKDAEGLAKMISYGYPEDDVTVEQLAETPWLFIGLEHNPDFSTSQDTVKEATLTANGKTVNISGQSWYRHMGKYSSSYVNMKNNADGNNPVDVLGLTGSAYTFVLNIDYESKYAKYELTCDYVKPGVNAEDLKTVTFKTSAGDVLATYKGAAEDTVTVPTHPELEGYYFAGWDKEGATDGKDYTVGEGGDVTAQYVEIKAQTFSFRPDGPEGHGSPAEQNFGYAAAYGRAGLALTKAGALTVDGATLVSYAGNAENAVELSHLKSASGKKVVAGVAYDVPAGATHVGCITNLTDSVTTKMELVSDNDNGTIHGNQPISYIPVADIDEENVVAFVEDKTMDSDYYVWYKGEEVIAVTKADLTLATTNKPTFTVTFKDGDETVDTATVDYNSADWTLADAPEKAGNIFLGWFDGETEVKAPKALAADLTLTAKWAPVTNMTEVSVSLTGAAAKLGVTVTEYTDGAITFTVDEAEWAKLTEEDKTALVDSGKSSGRLFVRVNFAVPADVDNTWTFVGSTNNGESWRGVVEKFDADRLKAVGLDTTKDANGRVTHLGQWFTIAEVKDGKIVLPEGITWTILYKWTKGDTVQFTTCKLTRAVKPVPVVTNPETNETENP